MLPSRRNQVLAEFLPFARLLSAFNSENFQSSNRRIWHLIRVIGIAILLASLLVVFSFNCWSCFVHESQWSQRAYQLASAFCLMQQFVIYAVMAANNRRVLSALEQLQEIVDKRQVKQSSNHLYNQIEQRYISILNNSWKTLIWAIGLMYAPPLHQPVAYVIFNNPKPSEWQLPHGYSVPLPGNAIVVYFIAWSILMACSLAYFLIIFVSSMYFVGMCFYLEASTADLKAALADLDKCLKLHGHFINTLDELRNHQTLANGIRFHNEILDLARTISDTMSTVLFCQLLFSALELAFFVVAIEANDIMSLENVSSLMAVLTILLPTYLFCNLAENSTVDLEVSADAFYECSWYNLSTRQQRIFLLPIQRGQAEVRMNALGMVDVSLALFLAIIRKASSFFLLMRTFE